LKAPILALLLPLLLFGCDAAPVQLLDFIQRSAVLEIPAGDSTSNEFDGAKYLLVSQLIKSCDCIVDTNGEVCTTFTLFSGDEPFEIEHTMGNLALFQPADATPLLQSGNVNQDGTFSLGFIIPITNDETGDVAGEGLVLMEGTIDQEKMLFTSTWHLMSAAAGRQADCQIVVDYVFSRVEESDD
jgi:hypothetical protein